MTCCWFSFSFLLVLCQLALVRSVRDVGRIGRSLRTVGDEMFEEYPDMEPSGLVWLPHKSLLAGVSDDGAVFLFNPDDDDEYYVDENVRGLPDDYGDLEGITVDTYLIESGSDPNHLYVVNEDPPALIKL